VINLTGASPNPFLPNVSNTSRRTQQNTASFDLTAANPVSNQGDFVLSSSALVSAAMRAPGGGWISISVNKAEGYSADNPVFLVKGTNADGTPFEAEINVNSISPRNASLVELSVLDAYYVANGQELGAGRAAVTAKAAAEALGRLGKANFDAFSRFDSIPLLQEMMDTQRINGNLSGYARYRSIVDSLLDFIAQK